MRGHHLLMRLAVLLNTLARFTLDRTRQAC
jgi:hypothetical protein